jgi:cytochrome P450
METKTNQQIVASFEMSLVLFIWVGLPYFSFIVLVLKHMIAGSDTTKSSLLTFFGAMMLHQDVQKKLQSEVDRSFVGRLPVLDELVDLPYLRAVVWELYR